MILYRRSFILYNNIIYQTNYIIISYIRPYKASDWLNTDVDVTQKGNIVTTWYLEVDRYKHSSSNAKPLFLNLGSKFDFSATLPDWSIIRCHGNRLKKIVFMRNFPTYSTNQQTFKKIKFAWEITEKIPLMVSLQARRAIKTKISLCQHSVSVVVLNLFTFTLINNYQSKFNHVLNVLHLQLNFFPLHPILEVAFKVANWRAACLQSYRSLYWNITLPWCWLIEYLVAIILVRSWENSGLLQTRPE